MEGIKIAWSSLSSDELCRMPTWKNVVWKKENKVGIETEPVEDEWNEKEKVGDREKIGILFGWGAAKWTRYLWSEKE